MSVPARKPLRRIIETCVLAAVVYLAARAWLIDARVIVSGSMAPALLGPHWKLTCGNCGQGFAVADDGQDADLRRAVCGNCGHADNPLAAARRAAGDRVLIDRSAFQFRPPRRWEVVALRPPHAPQDVVIKRVVGLPGESIQIRDGEVYADGRLVQKSLAEFESLAIPVHDDRFRAAGAEGSNRWRGGAGTRWQATPRGYVCDAEGAATDWLVYHHLPGPVGDRALTDSTAYNQLTPRRLEEFRPAGELLLTCSLRVIGEAALRISDGRQEFEVRLRVDDGRVSLRQQGRELAAGRVPPGALSDAAEVRLALCDRRLLLSIDGERIFAHHQEAAAEATRAPIVGVAVGAAAGRVSVEDLRLRRDVYYTRPESGPRTGVGAACRLAADEYFVLGDNSPRSDDSRWWRRQPRSQLLLGKPVIVYFPSRGDGGGGGIQVPDWEKIRYIR